MAAPDPEGFSLLSKLGLSVGSILGAAWGGVVYLNNRFDKKADKEAVNKDFVELKGEISLQRERIVSVFEQIRENEQRAQDRHERLMERMK